ncbi:MAG: universal stress protein [Candidatus Eremiobacteraeota bacterium]|nr:universal stress protein [Candidatus Eremiobacteraeota bacterium]
MEPVFHKIVVPVDGSTASERGVSFALELAGDGGRVAFCSVVDPMLVCAPAGFGIGTDPGPMLDVLDRDAALFVGRALEAAAVQSVGASSRVLHGMVVPQIESFADDEGADAMVIGTHGRTGIARAVLGSVAEGVLRSAKVPVVAVHEDDEVHTGPLAVAFDASPAAHAALDVALGIAQARRMALVLIHVENADPRSADVEAVEDAMGRARSGGVTAQLAMLEGAPADEIVRVTAALECSMIVMGTHGRSPLAQLVLGSVACAVVQRARIPVVTVRCRA